MKHFISLCRRPVSRADIYGLFCLAWMAFAAWSAGLPWYGIAGIVMTIAVFFDWIEEVIAQTMLRAQAKTEEGGA